MSDKNNGLVLDNAAEQLFAELGGLDTRDRSGEAQLTAGGFLDTLSEEEKLADSVRTRLVETAHLLANFLTAHRLNGQATKSPEDVSSLLVVLDQLKASPLKGDKIILRFRGINFSATAESGESENSDFVISYGNAAVDSAMVKSLTRRQGLTASHLPGRLTRAYEIFSSLDIHTLHLEMGDWSPEARKRLAQSVITLSRYFAAVARWKGGDRWEGTGPPPLVLNEYGQPDPNLTQVAGINNLSQETIKGLIKKVEAMMAQAQPGSTLDTFPSIYDACFAFKKIREQLAKPPIEINNVRWLLLDRSKDVVSREKARLARLVMGRFGDSPQKAARIMDGIYGADVGSITAENLEDQLEQVTDFLRVLEGGGGEVKDVEDEVLHSMEKRLDRVSEDVLDELVVPSTRPNASGMVNDAVRAEDANFTGVDYGAIAEGDVAGEEGRSGSLPDPSILAGVAIRPSAYRRPVSGPGQDQALHEKLADLVTFFKRRSGTKKKIRDMLSRPIDFDTQDYETIARDFSITSDDSQELLRLLRGCFSPDGRFLRDAFDRSTPSFVRYEKKVFEFLWHYLKEIMNRDDRVAFLNSLQLLISKMEQPQRALLVLLNDFVNPSDRVGFSDRNALMLASILCRKYNKELKNDIEITPEEVLLVREGLDRNVAAYASDFLDTEQEEIFKKLRTIHGRLKESLEAAEGVRTMPVRYLSTLERELYIFMSLVGGRSSHRILISSVREYGDPGSDIYRLRNSQENMKALLQLLQVALRGLVRFGELDDKGHFQQVLNHRSGFLALRKDSTHADLVRRVLNWAESGYKALTVDY